LFAPEDGAVDPAALTGALLADAPVGVTMLSERVVRVVIAVAGRRASHSRIAHWTLSTS